MNNTPLPLPEHTLDGRVCLITGAGSGIGRAEALLFARAGAVVVAADINDAGLRETSQLAQAQGHRLHLCRADLRKPADVQTLADAAQRHTGAVDVLCNTAGILDDYTRSLDTSEELWDSVFDINVKSVFRLTNALLPAMLARGKGVIVNIASVAATIAGGGGAAYTASKHAVLGYTRQLSYDYGRKGIRANALCPGMVESGMTAKVLEDQDSKFVRAVKSVPAGRYGQPEDIASVALFLASDAAAFMHGAAVMVDGGLTVK